MLFSFFLDKLAQEKKEWKSERETLKQEVEAKKQEKLRYQVNFTKKLLNCCVTMVFCYQNCSDLL